MPRRALARWFLDVGFPFFFQTTLISEADAALFVVQKCQVAGLVHAFLQPGDHFGNLGAPWGTMGAADRSAWSSSTFTDLR